MCWSAESSKNAYIIGLLSSVILLVYGDETDKCIGLFFTLVVHIQLIEYFIWKYPERGNVNNIATKMIFPVLILQMASMVVGYYLFQPTNLSKEQTKKVLTYVAVITFLAIGSILYLSRNIQVFSKKIQGKGILWGSTWDVLDYKSKNLICDITTILYLSTLFITPLFWKSKTKKCSLIAINAASLLWINHHNKITWKSRWCYPSAFIPLLSVIMMLLDIK
jgi:hypothetical protein